MMFGASLRLAPALNEGLGEIAGGCRELLTEVKGAGRPGLA